MASDAGLPIPNPPSLIPPNSQSRSPIRPMDADTEPLIPNPPSPIPTFLGIPFAGP